MCFVVPHEELIYMSNYLKTIQDPPPPPPTSKLLFMIQNTSSIVFATDYLPGSINVTLYV